MVCLIVTNNCTYIYVLNLIVSVIPVFVWFFLEMSHIIYTCYKA